MNAGLLGAKRVKAVSEGSGRTSCALELMTSAATVDRFLEAGSRSVTFAEQPPPIVRLTCGMRRWHFLQTALQ